MSWISGLEMELLGHSLCQGHPLKRRERTSFFTGSTTMSSIPPRIAGPFKIFHKKLREGTLELT